MSKTREFDPDVIRAAFAIAPERFRAGKVRHVCREIGCSPGTVQRALKGRSAGGQSHSPGGPSALGGGRRAHILPVGHPATMEGRTLFPTMVLDVRDEWLLKEGGHSAKIGSVVAKGAWKGFPIYTLTLEERATCPVSCRHWGSCFGNNTPYARRWRHGEQLEWRLEREVAALELRHRAGWGLYPLQTRHYSWYASEALRIRAIQPGRTGTESCGLPLDFWR